MGEIIQFVPLEHITTEHAYQVIQHAITTARNDFIADYQIEKYGSEFQTYESEFDRVIYKTLGRFSAGNQEAFRQVKQGLDAEITCNLQTAIGERLNAGLSTYAFHIENGALTNENTGSSIVAMIDRGRQTRNAQVDGLLKEGKISPQIAEQIKQRHDAEVIQFEKIQKEFAQPDDNGDMPRVGKTIISISPPGPGYAHNFYDVFVLKQNADGTRYVEAKRYASQLKAEDSLKQIQKIKPQYGRAWIDTSALIPNFLREPVVIDDSLHLLFGNPEGVHSHMQSDENAMTENDFALIKNVIAGIVTVYLKEIFEHPDNIDKHAEILDALMNKADEAVGSIQALRQQVMQPPLRRNNSISVDNYWTGQQTYAAALADISRLGLQPVRTVTTGCGESGNSRKKRNGIASLSQVSLGDTIPGNLSSFNLLDDVLDEDGPDGKGPLEFTCDKCSGKHTRPLGGYLLKCPVTGKEYKKCA